MARTPIHAAGGIVVRIDPDQPRIAIVQRRKDDCWVLPKGKLKPNEKPIAGARREAIEETGHDVRVHEFLGVVSYEVGSGPKLVQFWRMEALAARGPLMRDIKAVEWLTLRAAIKRLDLPHEQMFLRGIGARAIKHAEADVAPAAPGDRAQTEEIALPDLAPPPGRPVAVDVAMPAAAPPGFLQRLWRSLHG